jgi:hypothetical protein
MANCDGVVGQDKPRINWRRNQFYANVLVQNNRGSPTCGTLTLFVTGAAGQVYVQSQTPTGWSGWAPLGSAGGGLVSEHFVGTVTVSNLTHPDWGSAFAVGDTFQVTITGGAPYEEVSVSGSSSGTASLGKTDGNGSFTVYYG